METVHHCVLKVPELPELSACSVTSALKQSFSGVFDTFPHTAVSRFSRAALYPQRNSAGAETHCPYSQVYPTDSFHLPS